MKKVAYALLGANILFMCTNVALYRMTEDSAALFVGIFNLLGAMQSVRWLDQLEAEEKEEEQ